MPSATIIDMSVSTAKRRKAEALDVYVGRYRTAPGVDVVVGDLSGALYAQVRGAPPILLLSEGDGLFYAPENGLSIAFRRKPDGRVAGFTLRQSGRPDLSADRLASLAA